MEVDSRAAGRSAWLLVAVLWIAYCLNYTDRQVIFSLFPSLRRELGFSDAQLGLVGALFTCSYAVCMPIAGRLADAVPRQRLIAGSIVLWSVATLGTSVSTSISTFLTWRVIMGLTESLYVPAAVALIATVHTSATRSKALAFHNSAQFAGMVLGGWYGGWSADHTGWRFGLRTLAFSGLAVLVCVFIAVRGRVPIVGREQSAAGKNSELVRSPAFVALVVAFFFLAAMLWMLYGWLPTFLHERFSLSMTESGLRSTAYLQSSSLVGVVIGGVLGDSLARRLRSARLYLCAAGIGLSAPFAWFTYASNDLDVCSISTAGFGLLAGLFIGNLYAGNWEVVSRANYGFSIGVLNLAGGLAAGLALYLAGLLKHSLGMSTIILYAGLASGLSSAVLATILWKRSRVHLI